MKTLLKIAKVVNIIALCFLILGPYGIAFTGLLQVLAAVIFLIPNHKNPWLYVYFLTVAVFFIIWGNNIFGAQFLVPLGLMIYLTYLIHFQKTQKL